MASTKIFKVQVSAVDPNDEGIVWVHEDHIQFVSPAHDDSYACRIMFVNGITMYVKRLPPDKAEWAKKEW